MERQVKRLETTFVFPKGMWHALWLTGAVFILQKLAGSITWSWWAVTSPFWFPFAFMAIVVIAAIIIAVVIALVSVLIGEVRK